MLAGRLLVIYTRNIMIELKHSALQGTVQN
jgi:hypothetical protein